ncbi:MULTISPECIES: heavy metal-responsive transcriptional regulator [unclassified Synechocystis]|uniref:heavy metal-responsive transcriptional regulator n=1 Tax=unclassified Synechocystis TaxID=2640012 RepID=UPI00040CF78B|nr:MULTISPECIES: heavy metal-responsive transcriptional regulator [unclassified Synechocystis]AIE72659.1 Mercuric resistance operon regulatory protein [Synechocystis sp. PCC 6714]MCT0254677.1 heavy metal-responsive transcriptional regulator [Synechocystis sp. CS-94]
MVSLLKIGDIAKQTGVSVGTLRYYETLQLIFPEERGDNRYRYYDNNTIQQVGFIKKAQSLGFSLEEIRQILEVTDHGEPPCDLVKTLLAHKIKELNLKIKDMMTFKSELERYSEQWSAISEDNKIDALCPLIASVER